MVDPNERSSSGPLGLLKEKLKLPASHTGALLEVLLLRASDHGLIGLGFTRVSVLGWAWVFGLTIKAIRYRLSGVLVAIISWFRLGLSARSCA